MAIHQDEGVHLHHAAGLGGRVAEPVARAGRQHAVAVPVSKFAQLRVGLDPAGVGATFTDRPAHVNVKRGLPVTAGNLPIFCRSCRLPFEDDETRRRQPRSLEVQNSFVQC